MKALIAKGYASVDKLEYIDIELYKSFAHNMCFLGILSCFVE
jgi:hypothetical protein